MRKSPIAIEIIPNVLNQWVGIWGTFSINAFIFSGKVKYGSPSKMRTKPKTVKK